MSYPYIASMKFWPHFLWILYAKRFTFLLRVFCKRIMVNEPCGFPSLNNTILIFVGCSCYLNDRTCVNHFTGVAHGVILRVIAVLRKLQSLYSTISCHQKAKNLLRIVILFFFIYSFLTATGYQGKIISTILILPIFCDTAWADRILTTHFRNIPVAYCLCIQQIHP